MSTWRRTAIALSLGVLPCLAYAQDPPQQDPQQQQEPGGGRGAQQRDDLWLAGFA